LHSLAPLLRLLLADQKRRWEQGERPPVEAYLERFPAVAANPEAVLDLVYHEIICREARNEVVSVEEYRQRFPHLASQIEAQLALDRGLRTSRPPVDLGETTTAPGALMAGGRDQPARRHDAVEQVPSVPGYEFLRVLGRAGFGTVWLARHLALGKLVAVKSLRAERVAEADLLVREARTMAALKVHPNRVTVFDLIQGDTGWLLVLDYVEGGPLAARTDPGRPMDWLRAARYVADVADGLAEVHARGILHRDIKPDNVLLDQDRDVAVLTDFGVSAHAADARGCCGTVGYMAPELCDGKASPKTDVFALAATLFHLVIGRKPFDTGDLLVALCAAVKGLPEAELAGLPPGLAAAIRAGLEPDPDHRPDLAAFTALLRGCHNDGLAARLRALAAPAPKAVRLNVTVSTASEADLVFRTVYRGALPTDGAAGWPAVRCDNVVRIESQADADGYLTVLNLSSSGEVGVLFPNPRAPDNRLRAGRPHRLTVKMTPPAGTDHAVLVWTPRPCPLSAREWRERIEAGHLVVPAAQERGMEFVALDEAQPAGPDWVAAVVGIEHGD
jgi:hypothetical protein